MLMHALPSLLDARLDATGVCVSAINCANFFFDAAGSEVREKPMVLEEKRK
jgi:hypothetical protein